MLCSSHVINIYTSRHAAMNFIYKNLGSETEAVTREWRKLHSEKLHNLYSSPYRRAIKSRRVTWRDMQQALGVEKRVQLGGRFSWQDNIKSHLKGIGL